MNKIIMIDDDRFVIEQFSELIDWNSLGFSVPELFTNAADALAYIRLHHVDAVITDIKMNEMSGLDLIEICHNEFPDIEFAIISAHREFSYAHRAMKYGIKEYILKPIIYKDFVLCIKNLAENISQKRNPNTGRNEDSVTQLPDTILTAISYMNNNLHKDLSLNDVAAHVGYHPNYFSAFFKKSTGDTFLNYLTKLRIAKAKLLLRTTNFTISAICDMIGYKNHTHFYNIFRKSENGMTPLEYRNLKSGR